jgi:hypothetical protein
VDGRIGVSGEDDCWPPSLFANNIFNQNYDLSALRDFFGTSFCSRGTPRVYGVEIPARF